MVARSSAVSADTALAAWMACFARRDAESAAELRRRDERRGVVRVERMGRDGGNDQLVVFELLDVALRARESLRRRFRIGDRKLDDGLAEHAPQTRLARGARDCFLE